MNAQFDRIDLAIIRKLILGRLPYTLRKNEDGRQLATKEGEDLLILLAKVDAIRRQEGESPSTPKD